MNAIRDGDRGWKIKNTFIHQFVHRGVFPRSLWEPAKDICSLSLKSVFNAHVRGSGRQLPKL